MAVHVASRTSRGRRAVHAGLLAAMGACGSSTDPPPVREPVLISQVPIPANFGIHDTFVRDGLAFVSAWHTGLMIFDVGNGTSGGKPSAPVLRSTTPTTGGATHNAWWFQNPASGERRYLFVGQETSGKLGVSSSGDIHVLDVSDLAAPVTVGSYHRDDAGTHNFWVDEPSQILYAAYYNGGVVAIDISGPLPDSLARREIDRIAPGGPGNTYVWGVHLFDGSLYANDMLSGLWQLELQGSTFRVRGGGNNVRERYSSDFWVHGGYAYAGTWGVRNGVVGNAVKIWRLNAGGAPVLQDSIITSDITTVSDVEVSDDGRLLMFSTAGGSNGGVHFYSLANPAKPAFVTKYLVATDVHTATFGRIAGRLYAFAAKEPPDPALLILDVTDLGR